MMMHWMSRRLIGSRILVYPDGDNIQADTVAWLLALHGGSQVAMHCGGFDCPCVIPILMAIAMQ